MPYKTPPEPRTPAVTGPSQLQFAGGGIAGNGPDVTDLFEDVTTRTGITMQMLKTIGDRADRWQATQPADYQY